MKFAFALCLALAFAASSFAQTAKATATINGGPGVNGTVVAGPYVGYRMVNGKLYAPMPTAAPACPCQQPTLLAPVRTIAAPVVGFALAAPQAVGGRLRDWWKNRHHILPHTVTKSTAVTRER